MEGKNNLSVWKLNGEYLTPENEKSKNHKNRLKPLKALIKTQELF